MEPLRITAHLASPCVPGGPLLLDGILYYGVGISMGRRAGGWVGYDAPYLEPLPLARVETAQGWWWASSQATPVGEEACIHTHRRASSSVLADWTKDKSLNWASGPDKSLRIPVYYRWRWRTVQWSAFGDALAVALLLAHIPALGQRTTQGWGRVERWDVRRVDGPPVEDYARCLELRHLPVSLVEPGVSRVTRRNVRLRPPYYSHVDAIPCWQIPELRDDT